MQVFKGKYFIIIAIIIVLIIGLSLLVQKGEEKKTLSLGEQLKKALKQDKSACKEIKDKQYRNRCLSEFTVEEALEQSKPALCEELDGEFSKQCKFNYFVSLAKKEKEPGYCSNLQSEGLEDKCLKKVVNIFENEQSPENSCEVVEEEELNNACKELSSLPSVSRLQVPTKKECSQLKNELAQKICFSLVENKDNISIPVGKSYTVICEGIEEEGLKNQCFEMFKEILGEE